MPSMRFCECGAQIVGNRRACTKCSRERERIHACREKLISKLPYYLKPDDDPEGTKSRARKNRKRRDLE